MADVRFTKLHALGNDFVLVDERSGGAVHWRAAAKKIAHRKTGVGFDQLLVLRPSSRVHAVLDIYNADGSMAEMCGNGLRAAALYLWSRGGVADRKLVLETMAGDRQAEHLGPLIECEMGVPRVRPTPKALARGVKLGRKTEHPVCVSVGNPHAVVFATPRGEAELAAWGRLLENHRAFPRRTNVEFVRVRDRHVLEVRVWERGVGITEACGTGAVASAVAAISKGLAESPVEIRFPGGEAEVRWEGPREPAFLRGPAAEVFQGTFSVIDGK
jgi:diaminopimelate epimerase